MAGKIGRGFVRITGTIKVANKPPSFDPKQGLTLGKDYVLELIKPSQMKVRLGEDGKFLYQRSPERRAAKIVSIARNFDYRRVGTLDLVRDGEDYFIIDGLGRKTAMDILGLDTPVPCFIHGHIKTLEDEARWFLLLNPPETARPNTSDKWRARIASGDTEAIEVDKAASTGGLIVGTGGKRGISVPAATALHTLGTLTTVGYVTRATWDRDHSGGKPRGVALLAVGAFLAAAPKSDQGRLREILRNNSPEELMVQTKNEYGAAVGHARNAAPRCARIIAKLYNKWRQGDQRVVPIWSRVDKLLEDMNDRWHPINDSN